MQSEHYRMEALFEFLKQEVQARRWNVSRLAEACDVDIALASRWIAEKIASALGADPDYVLQLAGHRASRAGAAEPDLVEQEIRARTAEMRDAVRDVPREFWGTIIKATFDRAIEGARDMAGLLAQISEPPVSDPAEGGVSAPGRPLKRDRHDQEPPLAHRKPAPQLLPAGV
jgi:hypothetical protein